MNQWGKLIFLLVALAYFIAPDPMPGPIDDVIVAVICLIASRHTGKNIHS